MTHETAHKILSVHQAWRRGLVDTMEYTAAEVSEALELAIIALQSDPDAPDWSQAPEWARWYAIDGDGQRLKGQLIMVKDKLKLIIHLNE